MKNEFTTREDGVAEIVLTQGKVALVDVEDLRLLADYRWCADNHHERYWKARGGSGSNKVYMHRLLLGARGGQLVDHINHDCLDNRRINLRICTTAQNGANRRKQREATSSRYKGVSWQRQAGKWRVRIKTNGKYHLLGRFDDEEEAAHAYDRAAREHFGEYALPNFAIHG